MQQYWVFQDILPMIKGVFLLENKNETKVFPVYEMIIGMANTFRCDNDHLLNLAIALQMFEKIDEYAQMQEKEKIKNIISGIAKEHKIEFLTYVIENGRLLFDEMDYKINGTLIAKKDDKVIIRNIRKEYFIGYFKEEDIISENQLAWYVIVTLHKDEELADLSEIFREETQKNKLQLLKRMEDEKVFNLFMPQRIIRNRISHELIGFLNPASANDRMIVYEQKKEENEKDGFLKFLHAGIEELRGCWLFKDDYDILTVDFFATFYLQVVKNRWGFCIDLEDGKDCFYQEYLIKKYLQDILKEANREETKDILDDFYSFIIRYFDFENERTSSLMDGELLAFPLIRGFDTILKEYYSESNIKKQIFGELSEEWVSDVAKYESARKWKVKEKTVYESEFLNVNFEKLIEIGEKIPKKSFSVFTNNDKIVINNEFEQEEKKVKKLSKLCKQQFITYADKMCYMNDNLSRVLKLMDANDLNHEDNEMFQCDSKAVRESVYLYKIFWHFQVYEMDTQGIEKFWNLILNKHYLGMVEKKSVIKQYFKEMKELAQEEGTLVIAKESSGGDPTLYYLYEHFMHMHGERNYLSEAFDANRINTNLKVKNDTILWHEKPLKKIVFMIDNLMKGSSLRNLLDFHIQGVSGKNKIFDKRDYLRIAPTVKKMIEDIPNLSIEVHSIFGFKECVEKIENEYLVHLIIHEIIPDKYYSDQETLDLVWELYREKAEKGVCCVFRYNNLPAKNVLPDIVCDYKKRIGLFHRAKDLV